MVRKVQSRTNRWFPEFGIVNPSKSFVIRHSSESRASQSAGKSMSSEWFWTLLILAFGLFISAYVYYVGYQG
jgi:hypothetical protein